MLWTQIEAMWKQAGEFDIPNLGYDYFLIRFDDRDNSENVLSGRPWVIQDHYLMINN